MSKIPDKIYYRLGYDNLAIILDQERKHWLMKTDKRKTIQTDTGDMYRGTIDNIGSDVIIESEKLPETDDIISKLVYVNDNTNKVLKTENSSFTYSNQVNGFMFARVLSINYPTSESITDPVHKTFRLKLTNCRECIIPFGGSVNSDAVFADRWLVTTDTPVLQLIDGNGEYTIPVNLIMENCTNGKYYFPLNETLQPVNIHQDGFGTYITDALTDNSYIGYPLYWFTCDETNVGPQLYIDHNGTPYGRELCLKGNPGNKTKYDVNLYVGVDGNNDATPTDAPTSSYEILCSPKISGTFDGTDADFDKPLLLSSIKFKNTSTDVEYSFGLRVMQGDDNTIVTMTPNEHWNMIDSNTYSIPMDAFDTNCINNNSNALTAVFDVVLNNDIPFANIDKVGIGYAGIRLAANNTSSDIYSRYPYDLNEWDGLPDWLNYASEDGVPQHLAIYAIHNTPGYSESIPDSRQVAALLFDPGKKKTDNDTALTNDQRGRVYYLSNDDTEYRNNLVEKSKNDGIVKPERTLARICDIPTSLFQLMDVSGLSETMVVDKKYIRSYASFSAEDKNRLWNEVNRMDRWVRPSAFDSTGTRISTYEEQEGDEYVFHSVDMLNSVDMYGMNNFCRIDNLNSSIESSKVHLSAIIDQGSGYHIGNTGTIIVGGFAFIYRVEDVNGNGGVTDLSITADTPGEINIANFDMSGNSGLTETYGTSPIDPSTSGTGLKVQFLLEDYESLLPTKGESLDLLHALVHDSEGIYVYEYKFITSHNRYEWSKNALISPFGTSSPNINKGLSSNDAYISSILPEYRTTSVVNHTENKPTEEINICATASFMNIIDTDKTPVVPNQSSGESEEMAKHTKVNLCKFRCDYIDIGQATSKNLESVMDKLKSLGVLRYDCYVIWRWVEPNVSSDYKFQYGIIHRSLNNYISTDTTTKLPKNDLRYDKFVHTNTSTTVVWDAPCVTGVMMWVYDPSSTTVEDYLINVETQDLYTDRKTISWNDVDIYGEPYLNIVNPDTNKFEWNVMTNNPIHITGYQPSGSEPIYQQPEFYPLATIGSDANITNCPTGNWKLVFPRCESFIMKNIEETGVTLKPIQLQMLRVKNAPTTDDVYDENGNIVNEKSLILLETGAASSLNMYNSSTGQWNKI